MVALSHIQQRRSSWSSAAEWSKIVIVNLPTTMANNRHLKILHFGVEYWNHWLRTALGDANLKGANLSKFFLDHIDFREVNLKFANLNEATLKSAICSNAHFEDAKLIRANLENADFSNSYLEGADLTEADLSNVNLKGADLRSAKLVKSNLRKANLEGAVLSYADLTRADLTGADLRHANLTHTKARRSSLVHSNLSRANLNSADLVSANLSGANLTRAELIETNLTDAVLTGSSIYGASVWNATLTNAQQKNLVITRFDEATITIDNIEVAQFIYLLLNNRKIRDVIDTITSKVVLILGRFTPDRKGVLDSIRDELRRHDYLPILFDFEKPSSRDVTETVSTLAHMARFIIADLSEAKSVPQELQRVVPDLPSVPVQPILAKGHYEYEMFEHFKNYPWVLETYTYASPASLVLALKDRVIKPAEEKAKELRR